MTEIHRAAWIVGQITQIIIAIVGFWIIVSTGPERLFNDPLYALVVAVFFMTLWKEDSRHGKR